MAETIVTQELAIRAALPSAVPVTGSIPAENTLLIKDASTTVPTYEKCMLDGSISVSTVGGVKKLSVNSHRICYKVTAGEGIDVTVIPPVQYAVTAGIADIDALRELF